MTVKERLRLLADRVNRLESEIGVSTAATDARPPAERPMASIATMLGQIGVRIDQLQLRADALAGRIDVLQARAEARLDRLEVEMRELPGIIERGMQAALHDEANGR